MTTFNRRVYDVALNPEDFDPETSDPFDTSGVEVHRVVVIHADQMFGEREALKRGITLDQNQNMTSVIVWCSLKRSGTFTGTYEEFRDRRLLDIANATRPGEGQEVDPETGGVVEPVHPTEEPSGSNSSSPASSPASSTGPSPSTTA